MGKESKKRGDMADSLTVQQKLAQHSKSTIRQ